MLTLLLLAAATATPATPTCTLPDGTAVTVEVAVTDTERAMGLMYRDHLADDRGMIFVFDSDDRWPFWMKNTMIPLDFVWLDGAGHVVDVLADVPPCRRDPCPSYAPNAPARAMLEVNGGFAAAHRLTRGDLLRCSGINDYPLPE